MRAQRGSQTTNLKTTVREKEECEPHRVNTARRTQRMDEGETK